MGALEPWHLIVIAAIALFVFGPNKVAEVGGTLGKAVRDFREATEGKPVSTPPPALPPSATRSCATCHAPLAADAKFCSQCGATTLPIVTQTRSRSD